MSIEIKHRDTDAAMLTTDVTLLKVNTDTLSGAYLIRAGLNGAYLYKAYLSDADLYGADLSGAMIGEDKLDRLLTRATRSDGYEFFLFELQDGPPKIKAGCRWMTIEEYRMHVAKEYPDTDKAKETLDILNFFEARI